MKKLTLWILFLTVFTIGVELAPKDAEAIPAFARKYKTACITCHATFPRLTAQGEAFRLNGYKMPGGDELFIKDQPMSLGAAGYKRVFPKSVWPSDIPGMPPVAIRFTQKTVYGIGDNDPTVDFNAPSTKILAAGSMGEDMSFFTEFEFEDEASEISGWLMWEDLLDGAIGENHLNIKIGSVGMQDLALPNTRSHNMITTEMYLYTSAMGLHAEGGSNTGLELNGFDKWWRYNLGITQGDGETAKKDFYGAASFKLGGLGYDGSGGTTEEGGLSTTPAGYWRDDSIAFGFFGYRSYNGPQDEESDRYGVDLRLNYRDLSVAAGYISGKDIEDHMSGLLLDQDVYFGEAEYFAYPWLQPYVRFEGLSVSGADNTSRVIAGAVMLARANVKFNVEGRFYTDNEPATDGAGNRVVFSLDYAF